MLAEICLRLELFGAVTSIDYLAAKLKRKLQFICGRFTGRHGRAFLRPLAERQYASDRSSSLSSSLRRALQVWKRIITSEAGTRNFLDASEAVPSDVVLFTDGPFPDAHRGEKWEDLPPRIGLHQDSNTDVGVCLVELFGAVTAIDYLAPLFPRQRFLLLFASETVEASVIKGYGAKEDMCDLIAVF